MFKKYQDKFMLWQLHNRTEIIIAGVSFILGAIIFYRPWLKSVKNVTTGVTATKIYIPMFMECVLVKSVNVKKLKE